MNLPMEEFEEELRRGLRRVDAPPFLTSAVMDRIATEPRRVIRFPQRYTSLVRLAALLFLTALLAGVGATALWHKRAAERTQAERDFARSQELTSRALEPVRRHLRRAGVAVDE